MTKPVDQGPQPEPLASWRTLLRNFRALAVGEIGARLFGFVAVLIMARVFEPSGFGLVTVALTLVTWFTLVVDSGTELLNVREVARDPRRFREIADRVLGLRLALSVVAMGLFFAAGFVASGVESDRHVIWLFALMLPALALNLRWVVVGVGASRAVGAGNIGAELLFAGGILLLVHGRHDLIDVPIVRVAAEVLYTAIVLGSVARRFGVPRPRIDLAAWRDTIKSSLPLMANAAARAALYSFDVMWIAVVLGRGQVGFYAAAYKPVLFVSGIAGLFSTAFLASYSAAKTRRQRMALGSRTVRLAVFIGVPIAAVVSVASPFLVALLFGHAYAGAATPLAILIWTLPLLAITIAYGAVLIASDRQALLMRHNLAAAGFNVCANLVVVPTVGIIGAAVVTVASLSLVLFLNYRSSVEHDLAPRVGTLLRGIEGGPQVLARLRPSRADD